MSQSELTLEQFQLQLSEHYQQVSKSEDPLQAMRGKGWKRFLELGLPTRQAEVFQSVPLSRFFNNHYSLPQEKKISREQIAAHIYPECINSVVVFVNGRYQPDLSKIPENIVVTPLDKAISTYGIFLSNQWNKAMKEEEDPFAAVNTALHCDGVFIYVPPKVVVDVPLQILHFIDVQGEMVMVTPRVHMCVGANSQLRIRASFVSSPDSGYCLNQVNEITVEENAHVTYSQNASGQGEKVWHFDAVRVTQKRNSTFTSVHLTNGAAMIRHDYRVGLVGENAEASLNGLWQLKDKLEAHTNVLVDHQAPNCRSMQLFKGVLHDFSRSSFEGKIKVRREAQKTDAFQLNRNLLLSDRANADSKPNLEVFADDVKASHGATVGELDPEEIFYLKTRGFSETEAKDLLIEAFCKEIVDKA